MFQNMINVVDKYIFAILLNEGVLVEGTIQSKGELKRNAFEYNLFIWYVYRSSFTCHC